MKLKDIILDVGALLAGVAIVYAFAPFHYWGLALISLSVLLFIWLKTRTVKRAALRGFLYGLGFYGIGSYWQFLFISTFPAMYQPVMYLILGGIVAILIAFPMLYGMFLITIRNLLSPLWLVALFPFVWLIGEWVRTWLWTGFPYYQSSYAFVDTPLMGYASLGGELLITLVVLLTATLGVAITLLKPVPIRLMLLSMIGVLWFTGAQLQHNTWGMQEEPAIQVRLIHGMPIHEKKAKRYYVIDTIKQYLAFSKKEPKADIVIWPESSIATEIEPVYRYLEEEAHRLEASGTSILLGSYAKKQGQVFNTFMQASNLKNYYTKRHLIPFGEYTPEWPLIDLTKFLPPHRMDDLKEGLNHQELVSLKNIKFATAICYEIIFGNELRSDWEDANILIYISDLSWFKETWGVSQLLQMAQMRAAESGKPLLTSTNHGITAFVNSRGEITKMLDDETGFIDAEISPKTGMTPYTHFGNIPIVLFASFILLIAITKALWQILLKTRTPKQVRNKNQATLT